MKLLLLAQAAATLFMVGLIWMVQVVHYPLFDRVERNDFARFEADHQRLTTWVVAPPMLVELLTAVWLLGQRPHEVPAWSAWLGVVLVAVIWLSTIFAQVPQHNVLAHGFDEAAYRILVGTNWLRTVAWSVRGVLVLGMLGRVMR
ncbi:MAG: hypothetical protein JNM56_15815 [Planctomycetia bacterium]|nr:hypothetical protein [Planctomycetia bacterium]